ncbi:MAG: hypothetical protein FJY85_10365 [Deltaproteobacteria bacterium]|nr:hypothetical protein [Deltaproteobacteria bacterium]
MALRQKSPVPPQPWDIRGRKVLRDDEEKFADRTTRAGLLVEERVIVRRCF